VDYHFSLAGNSQRKLKGEFKNMNITASLVLLIVLSILSLILIVNIIEQMKGRGEKW